MSGDEVRQRWVEELHQQAPRTVGVEQRAVPVGRVNRDAAVDLALTRLGEGPGLSACRILSQAWPPPGLVAVIEHYRNHPADRAGLVDSTSLEQFLIR